MNRLVFYRAKQHTIAFVGNHLPRRCGIATFTTDLLAALSAEAPDAECWAIVMNDAPEGYSYPPQVRFELNFKHLPDYRLAADFLNINRVEVVCLQHEFGIFGGDDGTHVLEFLSNLRMPVVTTFHTVFTEPEGGCQTVVEKISNLSDRVVVMSHKAGEILREVYDVPAHKIVMIHHGIPDVPFVDSNYYKDQFGVEGRKVILTFGLLSPAKGLEYMIDALPKIVRKHPEAVYVILGATHPHVRSERGESYRHSLELRARDKGVGDLLIFHNRFVDLKELCEFLGAADIYVTPYVRKEQIVSGTLAYALGAGKAAISTPYWYAEEMLDEGRGRIVPFREAGALTEQVIDLLDCEVERHAMRKRAYTFCRSMIWKEVARAYLEVFAEVKAERERLPKPAFEAKTLRAIPRELPQLKLDHLIRLTDDVGLLQHANFMVADRSHGYCTDDNARALIVALKARDLIAEGGRLMDLTCRYMGFLHYAFSEGSGRFRNLMSYDRQWTEEEGSQDSHARAIWGLGMVVALSKSESLVGAALSIFEKAVSAMLGFTDPRAWAFGLVGIHAYLTRFSGDSEVRRVREELANRLFDLYEANGADDWPWIEETVTYANGKIPQALLLSGQELHRGDMIEAGLCSLEWLVRVQTDPEGHFVPIGTHGWWPKGGERARFDQQPIEANNMIEACKEAYNLTRDERWIVEAQRCWEWFLGRNDLDVPLYDYRSGRCCDALTSDGPNQNQGAESTLSWLLSLLNIHYLRGSRVMKGA